MGVEFLGDFINSNYEVHETRYACAILKEEFPREWSELIDVLTNFRLHERFITEPGGNLSQISHAFNTAFGQYGWIEKMFNTRILVDDAQIDSPTHSIDCFKNGVGLEIEWNNKDPFYDRDLNNFRLLFELKTLSVGIIVTRTSELQDLFKRLGRGSSYGASTTHMGKLLPKLHGGGAGGCPVLVLGIKESLYVPA